MGFYTFAEVHQVPNAKKPLAECRRRVLRSCQEAANTPRLHSAYDRLTGVGRWVAPHGLGTFPIRFQSQADPGDDGWHVDISFGMDAPDFMDWRANVRSDGHAS